MKSCLGQDYTVLIEEVLVFFVPLVPVNDTVFKTSAEGLEKFFILRLIVS